MATALGQTQVGGFYLCGNDDDLWPMMRNITGFFQKKADAVNYVSFGKVSIELDASIFEKTGGKWFMIGEPSGNEIKASLEGEDAPYIVSIGDIITASHDIMRKLEKIDMCKIDAGDMSRMILYDMLDAGYRPGIILVRFLESPDNHVATQLAAGHLQNCGYALMGVHEDKYLYYFTDNCLYDYCSWTQVSIENPLLTEFKSAFMVETKK
jgi:hypothetical protein